MNHLAVGRISAGATVERTVPTSLGRDVTLAEAASRYLFKLMAYKDEYEVARLYTSGEFRKRLEQQFEGNYRLHFHLAPPLLAKRDAEGRLQKKTGQIKRDVMRD